MPIYEYRCLGCGAHVEKMQKVSDEPLKRCEKCGGALEKQVSLSGFQFKGAGWYVTDYAGKSKETGAAKSEKSEKSETSEKGEKTEKSSASESTAAPEPASKQTSDTAMDSKNDAASKKD
jgi:putative FmdB family regulatory protein